MFRSVLKYFFILLLFNNMTALADSVDVKSGLKEAGVSTLPVFLDATTNNITLKMPKAMGGKKLTFGGSVDADALQDKTFVFITNEDTPLNWDRAFGLSFLNLENVTLNLKIAAGEFDVSLEGQLGGVLKKKNKPIYVSVALTVEEKKITDFSFSLPDSKLSLGRISEFKHIQGINKITLAKPTFTLNSLAGEINFLDETTNGEISRDQEADEWQMSLEFANAITLGKLTGHKHSFLKDIALPSAQLTLTKSEVTISATFDPESTSKKVKSALYSLGLANDSLEIDGDIKNMFSADTELKMAVTIDTPSNHGFSPLKIDNAHVEFFIELSKEQAGLGFRTAVLLSQGKGKDKLAFDVDFELKESDTNIEVQVAGAMSGDWKNAAGIRGLTLENPFLSMGINESGSFDTLIDGTVMIGSEKIRGAIDLVLSPEALGLPSAFAIAGEVNKVDFNNITNFANKHAKQKKRFPHMDVEFQDVAFAFMTPGSTLPSDLENELNIEGSGLALKGTLLVKGKSVASASGYASTKGLSVNGEVSPFKVGPMRLKDASLAIQAGPNVEPKFAFSGDMSLFKNVEEDYSIDIEPHKFSLYSDLKFGKSFEAEISVESEGLDFQSGDDLSFDGTLAANYTKIFHKAVSSAVKGLKSANKKLTDAQHDLTKKQHSVDSLNTQLAKAKKDAKSALDHATKKINSAKNKVDKLKKTIAYNKKKEHDLDKKARKDAKHLRLGKSAKDGTKEAAVKTAVAAEEASLKTANWALEQAKKTVKIVPVDSAPKVVSLTAELKTAKLALTAAKGFLQGIKDADNGVASALKKLDDPSVLTINKIEVSGSLKGITTLGKEGDDTILTIDVTVHKRHHVYHVTVSNFEKNFEKIVASAAKKVAQDIVNVFK
ncbi:hypothetical protein HR060_16035 [Catenovulum sp. SM1970]|uniref:hypothetical protein n=1 Tax=Marinifaba aquimaris TaxID=2741323 RepID=UPI001573624A|nr:hypothetical protein [Marinifaba aquimaris]NTS78363.1 hypothetical protein [Marinifaba aquimaris]